MYSARVVKKWLKMVCGKSILHVLQDEGKVYSKDSLKGYYNNLTGKVLNPATRLDADGIPYNSTNEGKLIYFPIAIFQYGLGAYDLSIMTGEERHKKSFMRTVEWAMTHQEDNGAWDAFSIVNFKKPYSSMAQGQGASLLVRAYLESSDTKYLQAAQKAIVFMCLPISDGGCAEYCNEKMWLKEYADEPIVLNGWIFSIWGIYDYAKVSADKTYINLLEKAINTLAKDLAVFDCGYWSKYDMGYKLASPFYHRLHIAQLRVLYDLFDCIEFMYYAKRWDKYQKNKLYSGKAFIIKVWQKLTEKKCDRVVIVG